MTCHTSQCKVIVSSDAGKGRLALTVVQDMAPYAFDVFLDLTGRKTCTVPHTATWQSKGLYSESDKMFAAGIHPAIQSQMPA